MGLIGQITQIYSNYQMDTEILVASVRHPIHVLESALMGADIVTCPLKVMKQLVNHPLTDAGIKTFLADWEKVPK
jgi:transaldolase